MSSMNPSAMLAESLAEFSKSAYQAFTEIENKARQEVARAAQEKRDAKAERDTAMKELHAAQLDSQSWKQEAAASKATLTQAELTIAHQAESLAAQVEHIAQLRRELTQWKDQSRNWQEHFLRVEQERCAQSSRIDELVVEKLQYVRPPTSTASYVTPKHPKYTSQISSAPTTISKHTIPSPTQPPAYRSAGSPSAEPETSSADSRQTPLQHQVLQTGTGSRMQKAPTKSQNVTRRERDAHPDVQEIAPPLGAKPRKSGDNRVVNGTTSTNAQGTSAQSQHSSTSGSNLRSSTVIRRVQAIVHVKREEDTEDEGVDGVIAGGSGSGSAKPNGTSVKRKKKEESLEGAGQALLNNRKKGVARGRSRSKRVISEDEAELEVGQENDSRRGTERSASGQDDDEEEGSEERGDADKNYNLRKPSRPDYREEDDEDDEDDDELMMGAEDNHEEVYGSHPVDSSRRQNGSPRKKRKFSAR